MKKNFNRISVLFLSLFIIGTLPLFSQGSYQVFGNQLADDVELFGALDNRLVYSDVIDNGTFVWVSDGTENGTFQLENMGRQLVRLVSKQEGVWYFIERAGSTYHLSVLTENSDSLVSIYSKSGDRIEYATYWNDHIYMAVESVINFSADDLIKLDPVTGATELLFTSDFGGMRGLGSTDANVMFIASMDEGKILGKTDGTVANTSTVKILYPAGSEFGTKVIMESDGDKMFFAYHPNNDPFNLWVSDGTEAGTEILNTYDHPSFGTPDQPFAFLDGKFYFVLREDGAPSGTTFELYVSDGTVNGTFKLNPASSGYLQPRRLTVFNNKIYFASLSGNWRLMSTDGTVAGTETVITSYGYQDGSIGAAYDIGMYNDSLVLRARNTEAGNELFISDGTLEGTSLLSDIVPGTESGDPLQLTQVGDLLFFVSGFSNKTLWVFDPNLQVSSVDETLVEAFKVFPNPALGALINVNMTVSNKIQSVDIEVYDLSGKQLLVESGLPVNDGLFNYQMSLDRLEEGIHIITISTKNKVIASERIKILKK